MSDKRLFYLVSILVLLLALLPPGSAQGATYTVNNTNDVNDGSCNPAHCSLREAMLAANANLGADTIAFNIPGAGVHTISPLIALPVLTDDGTVIDGYTQPGAAPAEDESPATILIEIEGSMAGVTHGLSITSADNTIRGLAIYHFSGDGIAVGNYDGRLATNNRITGNHIGTNAAGSANLGNLLDGVYVGWGADDNIVGGSAPSERNVLSANGWSGVEIHGDDTTGNLVSGNYIGTQANGFVPLGNSLFGMRIYGGAQDNTIGGDTPGERNVISGNDLYGVSIDGPDAVNNRVTGNYIGTHAGGAFRLGNTWGSVLIDNGAANNTIGGAAPGEGNLISGNGDYGVRIWGARTATSSAVIPSVWTRPAQPH